MQLACNLNLKSYNLFLIYSSFFIFNSAFSQGGTWTWISGANSVNASGVFGTQGVPSVNNHPPALYEPVEWKDKQGNFWLYAGVNYQGGYSDLWKYNPVNNEWTWVKGNGGLNSLPVHGTIGVANTANTPGARIYGAATWVDTSGTFWLFGGSSCPNDLWSYNISTNEWTWVNGGTVNNAKGVYGTQGIPGALNIPGTRCETASSWTDTMNNLWLFGGWGYDKNGTSSGTLSDLWKYDISSNEWTWMTGSSVISAPPNYGTKGVFAASNDPGGRWSYTKWKDIYSNFWIMGGCPINGCLNDVWKYDLSSNEWSWMNGPKVQGDSGMYAANCTFDTIDYPQCRLEQRSAVTDNCGRFWLFGGINNSSGHINDLNDLWVFDPQQLKWNWVSGSSASNYLGNYGTKGVASPTNMPPARDGGVAWWGNDNRFYMFGGQVLNFYADLWVFNPDTNCVPVCNAVAVLPPVANFQANQTTLCANDCINFTDLSTNATSWQWNFGGAIDSISTAQNPQNICYPIAGIYDVTLIVSNSGGSNSVTFSNYINVKPSPPTPSITHIGNTLYCSTNPSYTSYQWYDSTALIFGATDTFLVITHGGNYNVQVSNADSCKIAVGINVVLGINEFTVYGLQFTVSPNPATDMLTVNCHSLMNSGNLRIYNVVGQILSDFEIQSQKSEINISGFPQGIYFIVITNEQEQWIDKFVKE